MNNLNVQDEQLNLNNHVSPSYDDETVIWEGRPSQWINFASFIFWIILSLGSLTFLMVWYAGLSQSYSDSMSLWVVATVSGILVISALSMLIPFLQVHCERTVITKNKITESKGISSLFREEKYCELSDIKDIKSPAAGLLAIVGLANLIIETADEDQPIIKIRAIRNRDALINTLLPIWRELKIERKGYFGDR